MCGIIQNLNIILSHIDIKINSIKVMKDYEDIRIILILVYANQRLSF